MRPFVIDALAMAAASMTRGRIVCPGPLNRAAARAWMRRMASDGEQVRAIIDRWAEAVQSRDMEGTLARHSPDILMFDVPEPIQARGLAEYRETWELFFSYSPGGPTSFRLHELEVVAGDSVAFAHALLDVVDVKCRLTIALRKIEGEWMIVHEHHSSPWPDPRELE